MPEPTQYRRSPEVVAANLGDKSFLLHVGDWVYLELNSSGSRIWELLEAETSARTLVDTLLTEFDIDRDTCTRETAEFLDTLMEKHFIVTV